MAWLVGLVGLAGCQGRTGLAVAGEDDVVAVFPPHGALRMWGDVPVHVVLGADADPDTVEVELRRGELDMPLPCLYEPEGGLVTCGPIPAVEAGEELVVDVRVDGVRHRARTEGRLPDPGLGWSLLDGAEITGLGGGSAAADLASQQLARGSMFAALDGYDGTQGSWNFVIAPSGIAEDGGIGIAPWGFGFVLPVTVASDGRIWGRADAVWLTTQIAADTVALLLLDVRMDARLDGVALVDLSLSATAPGVALDALADALGSFSGFMDLVKLDVDRDSDGDFDAASITLEGTPAPAALRTWE